MKENSKKAGIHLLEKGKRGIFRVIFSRSGLILVLLAMQVLFLFSIFHWFEAFLPHIYGGVVIFTFFMVLYLLNSAMDPTAKITWLVVVMLLPVFGALLFLYTQKNIGHRALKKRYAELNTETAETLVQSPETAQALGQSDPGAAALARYVQRSGCYPVYDHTAVTYFPLGEDKFREMLIQLEQAKRFIFLEYFIVDEGEMWGKILEILARKAKEGVEVRMLYDGTCELSTLPHDYPRRLRSLGIQSKMFAPIKPFVSTHYNYRDHRKILVIDGETAFNGGINLADEYINKVTRFGHWKDSAILLRGEAVWSMTVMFLSMWDYCSGWEEDFDLFRPESMPRLPGSGWVQPYTDTPLDHEKVGQAVYLNMISRARDYIYITTPYLIVDVATNTALCNAAKAGVDVRIITPHIPDKRSVFEVTKAHYPPLLEAGVKIYEYTPGFIHAKNFVVDGRYATVGTVNLDYRSLFLHFEDGVWLCDAPCIADIKADFEKTLEQCEAISLRRARHLNILVQLYRSVLRIFAPLM